MKRLNLLTQPSFTMYQRIEKIARSYALPIFSGIAKTTIAYPRYYAQLRNAKKGYATINHQYRQSALFVAGLPKSGTTWLEKMLCSLEGFQSVMIPSAVNYEQKHGESHSFPIPDNTFDAFQEALVVLKLHAGGSAHNFQVLAKNNLKFVVIYRDLRDVAVSYIFYVKRTAYHPEHYIYRNLSINAALHKFAETLLPAYMAWIDTWHQYQDNELCYITTYEQLKATPFKTFQEIVKHYHLDISKQEIEKIITLNDFKKLSGGRTSGQSDNQSFFRKGKAGDWVNHFDETLKQLYKAKMDDFLVKYGFEADNNW